MQYNGIPNQRTLISDEVYAMALVESTKGSGSFAVLASFLTALSVVVGSALQATHVWTCPDWLASIAIGVAIVGQADGATRAHSAHAALVALFTEVKQGARR